MSIEIIKILTILSFLIFFIFQILKPVKKYIPNILIGSIFLILASSCTQGNLNITDKEAVEDNTLTRIADLPFVIGSVVNIEKSLILGEGKSWSGQLYITISASKPQVFNFYVKNLEDFGWKEQTTIRGDTSVLNYVGENNRVAMISITKGSFGKTELIISVAPYTEAFEVVVSDVINEKYLELEDWKKD